MRPHSMISMLKLLKIPRHAPKGGWASLRCCIRIGVISAQVTIIGVEAKGRLIEDHAPQSVPKRLKGFCHELSRGTARPNHQHNTFRKRTQFSDVGKRKERGGVDD